MEDYKNYSQQNTEEGIPIREIVEFVFRLKWWILGAAVLAVLLAFFYVRLQNPVFERSSWIMLNRDDGSTGELSLMSQMTGQRVRKKIDNEIFILKSPSLMRKVVEELSLNTRYYRYVLPFGDKHIGVLRGLMPQRRDEYYKDAPLVFSVQVDSLIPAAQQVKQVEIVFKHTANGMKVRKLFVNGLKQKLENQEYAYGETIRFENGSLTVSCPDRLQLQEGVRYACTWGDPFNVAKGFTSRLQAELQGNQKNTYYMAMCDVVMLTIQDNKPARADDILNTLVEKNNAEAKLYANSASLGAISFIDERLADISKELGNAERNVKEYQSRNALVDIASQANLTVSSDLHYRDQLTELKLQRRILEMVSSEIHTAEAGEYRVIPSNIGISDVGLNTILQQYNALVAERNRLVANSSSTNPRVTSLNSSIEDARKSIELTISNLNNVYAIRERELESTLQHSRRKISDIPRQQLEIQQMSRKMEIIEPLYLLLQQKREEAQIAMYSQTDAFRVIESSFGPATPVSPKSVQIYFLAFVLGCCLPPLVVWLRILLKSKVETRQDIEKILDTTILGILPRRQGETAQLLKKNARDSFSESFRMLRSNLQFLPSANVIQVTSSVPGEGKSFISANLSISLSHIGKKVLLVGMDLRKPALRDLFPTCTYEPRNSVVSYLVSPDVDLKSLPQPSGVTPNLDVLFAGPIPPNPTELLSSGKLGTMLAAYREMYDYVVIDSAPYLPVSDSYLINSFVDLTIYVVRANYSQLRYLEDLHTMQEKQVRPIRNLNLVLNDVDFTSGKYKHVYGYSYNDGYGYGYGNEGGE